MLDRYLRAEFAGAQMIKVDRLAPKPMARAHCQQARDSAFHVLLANEWVRKGLGKGVRANYRYSGARVPTEFHLRVSLDCQANQHESRFAAFDSYAVRERVSATEHDVYFSGVTDHATKCVQMVGR